MLYFGSLEQEEGQDLAEYALVIALVAIAAIIALGALSGGINGIFDSIAGTLGDAGG
ncbi:MAG: Flp family type IVb pilin [Chloroflexi bacterium]|nr:Flp family type IVb pilin [Chloroflexota bacterium]